MTTRIGKYEIQSELGRGAFTSVFRAFDPDLSRPVAVKIPAAEADKQQFGNFHRQAAAVAKLRHRNIVAIYECGEHSALPFLAVEYVEGETLRCVIDSRKPLTLLQRMLILSQVASALDCAHQKGGIHLDIRPVNIMVLGDGSVKLLDFSMARSPSDGRSLLYASPEQLDVAVEVDARSDIFAFGVVCYELLTGRHPFQDTNANGVISKIRGEDPAPLRSLSAECPEELERLVLRALHKDRELRY